MHLYESGEDYLEAVLVLQKKIGEVRSVDVARYVGEYQSLVYLMQLAFYVTAVFLQRTISTLFL